MIDFSSFLDLPLIWGILIATAIFLYTILDGFDLGCGIIYPFAASNSCKTKIMNSIAPFWDANETWLVLGGGGLFVAFPLAYAILMPAFYMPLMLMLMGLIFRGIAFEFRFKAQDNHKIIWDRIFHGGSLLATIMQGIILGNFIQGVEVEGRSYSGGALTWANGFSVFVGISLVFSYALLGATWLIMKTHGETQKWARKIANYVLFFVWLAMCIVSISMPFVEVSIVKKWFSFPNIIFLSPIPILTLICFIILWKDLKNKKREIRPFIMTMCIFLLSFIGLGVSLFPWIIPYKYTLWQAAATSTSQSIMLIGIAIFLPIILTYTALNYHIFRGKTHDKKIY